MTGTLQVVVGGQFGSEGKGAIAAYLSHPTKQEKSIDGGTDLYAVRVAGPNAGHTVHGRCPSDCQEMDNHGLSGHPWRLRQIPVAAVVNPHAWLVIAAGSEIDRDVLAEEIHGLEKAGYDVQRRLLIDRAATVIDETYVHREAQLGLIAKSGSTGKGIGAARADRALRQAELWGGDLDTADLLRSRLQGDNRVLIEGTQGYGLGLHTRFYPHTTSSDCRAIDFLAMAGLSPWQQNMDLQVVVVFRAYPIRIAGNSGPLRGETTWADLGLPEEMTTVTRKIRRVGEWDSELAGEALRANGGTQSPNVTVALTMLDQRFPEVAGATSWGQISDPAREWLDEINLPVCILGTSPSTVVDLRGTGVAGC